MAIAIRISEELIGEAKKHGKIEHRSLTGQIEHWARIGKCLEENPNLTYSQVNEIGLDELNHNEIPSGTLSE